MQVMAPDFAQASATMALSLPEEAIDSSLDRAPAVMESSVVGDVVADISKPMGSTDEGILSVQPLRGPTSSRVSSMVKALEVARQAEPPRVVSNGGSSSDSSTKTRSQKVRHSCVLHNDSYGVCAWKWGVTF